MSTLGGKMKLTTPKTDVLTRSEFNACIAEFCGWTITDREQNIGTPPSGVGRLSIPNSSQDLNIAHQVLQHVHRTGGDIYEKMVRLLPTSELWSLSYCDAAHMICNAFYESHTGCDVEIEDWDEDDC